MEILLVGQADSIFFEHFTKNLKKLDNTIKLDVFSIDAVTGRHDLSAIDSVYVSSWHLTKWSRIKGLRVLLEPIYTTFQFFLFLLRCEKKYDVIQFKWLKNTIILSSLFIGGFGKRRIGMFWGGELESQKLFFSKKVYLYFLSKFSKQMDQLVYLTEESYEKLKKVISEPEKLTQALYGSSILKELQNAESEERGSNYKSKWGIDSSKTTIGIGYSGKDIHQHFEVIETLRNDADFWKRKEEFVFLLPMTYGAGKAYVEKVTRQLKEYNFQFKIIQEKMSDIEVAEIRMATDIFIQVTKFDGRSSSVIEYIMAGSVMISGNWLPYKVFKDRDLYFHEVAQIPGSELPGLVLYIRNNFDSERSRAFQNREKWGFNETWEGVIPDWLAIYKQ